MRFSVSKKIILSLFVVVFACLSAFSAELWNGFTDEMNEEQVKSRADKMFEVEGRKPIFNVVNRGSFSWFRSDGEDLKNLPDSSIYYRCEQSQYCQDISDGNNIEFYFCKGKLCGVSVVWAIPFNTVKDSAIKQYGSPSENKEYYMPAETFAGRYYPAATLREVHWFLSEKRVILMECDSHSNQNTLTVFSDEPVKKFIDEKNQKEAEEQRKKAEEEKARNEKLVF